MNESLRLHRPVSSVGIESASGAGGRGFESRPHNTKGVKNGTSSSFKYLLKRYCYVAIKALQSLCYLFQIRDVK